MTNTITFHKFGVVFNFQAFKRLRKLNIKLNLKCEILIAMLGVVHAYNVDAMNVILYIYTVCVCCNLFIFFCIFCILKFNVIFI